MNDTDFFSTETITVPISFRLFGQVGPGLHYESDKARYSENRYHHGKLWIWALNHFKFYMLKYE